MSEAKYHGRKSEAYWDTVKLEQVTEWSVVLNLATVDASVMHATKTGKSRAAGFKGGTASVNCYLEGDNAIDEGTKAVLELLRDGTNASKGYKGTAICTSVEDGAEIDGVETVTYNFQFNGEITNVVTEGI